MTKIYKPAPGRTIPGGWPADGRPINDLNPFERRLVLDKDLVEMPEVAEPAKPASGGTK